MLGLPPTGCGPIFTSPLDVLVVAQVSYLLYGVHASNKHDREVQEHFTRQAAIALLSLRLLTLFLCDSFVSSSLYIAASSINPWLKLRGFLSLGPNS